MTSTENSIKKYAYDIEVFPNLFCVTFLDCDSQESFAFTIYKDIDDRQKLLKFLDREIQLVGFNNLTYDGPILYYVCTHNAKDLLSNLFKISGRLISDESRNDDDLRKLRYPRDVKWTQMDLMKIMAFDMLGVSLKQTAINLKWRRIQDLPLPYDHKIEPDEIDTVLDYNLNDVLITFELYKAIQPQINLRIDLGNFFGVNVTSASDSKMANIILEKIYAQETGADISQLKDLRTKRSQVLLADCFGANIEFQTEELNTLKEDIENITVTAESKFAYRKTIQFGGNGYELGIGGLHSKDGPGKFFATDDQFIRDADVASYYPSMIINNQVKPEHLGDDFIRILQKITQERLEAKRSGDKVKADGLKITINSIFGKLGSDTFWLEDAKAMLAVTVSGQLYLLMLIEALTLAGIPVISANTDGVVSQIPKELEDKYKEVCAWWQTKTGFELEFTDYALYVRTDVNNYITKKADGKTKEKGRYIKEIDLKKGYKHPIIPRCLYEYFINGKSVDQTLSEATDILDFCISQKTGRDFKLEYRTVEETKELQKTNRFYISNTGGVLVKRNVATNGEIGLFVGNVVRILNDFDDKIPFSEYDVNLGFYKKEAVKCIEDIDPTVIQVSMFDMFSDFQAGATSKLTLRDMSSIKNIVPSPKKIVEPEPVYVPAPAPVSLKPDIIKDMFGNDVSIEQPVKPSQDASPASKLAATPRTYATHPLKPYEKYLSQSFVTTAARLGELADEQPVHLVGFVIAVKPYKTKSNKMMGFVTLEDMTGNIELVIFPRAWDKFRDLCIEGKVIVVDGKVDAANQPPKVLVDVIRTDVTYYESPDALVKPDSGPKIEDGRPLTVDGDKPVAPPSSVHRAVPVGGPPSIAQIAEPVSDYIPAPDDNPNDDMPPPPEAPPEWDTYSVPEKVYAAAPTTPLDDMLTLEQLQPENRLQVEDLKFKVENPKPQPISVSGEAPSSFQTANIQPPPLQPIAPPPLVEPAPDPNNAGASDGLPARLLTVFLRPSTDPDRDRRRIKNVYGILISHPGKDRFQFQIFENGRGHLIDFPNDTTRIASETLDRLKKLMGEESWRIEEITYQ